MKFSIKDLFTMEFGDANVLTMYLLPDVNLKLRPKILSDMKPGSRIVSHSFDMDDWKPDGEDEVESSTIYFWIVPAKVEGVTELKLKAEGGQQQTAKLNLKQKFQEVTGTANIGGKDVEIKDGKLKGYELSFTADGKKYTSKLEGKKSTKTEAGARGRNKRWHIKSSRREDASEPACVFAFSLRLRHERAALTRKVGRAVRAPHAP